MSPSWLLSTPARCTLPDHKVTRDHDANKGMLVTQALPVLNTRTFTSPEKGTARHASSHDNSYLNHTTMYLDPIFTELLGNNELPSEPKLREAIQLRSQANEDLLQVDVEIQRLQARRGQLQSSIDIYNTILSPARRLLPDILQEIFCHCIGQTYPILSAMEAPMLLTRICSLWRSVALSSPQIWTRLHIPLPGDPRMSSNYGMNDDRAVEVRRQIFSKLMQLRCQAVKDWLDRSGSLPLSLSISFPFGYEPSTDSDGAEDDEVVDPLFRIIRPFTSRWRHLNLSMPYHIYQKLEAKIPLDNLSMLRYFKGNIFLHSYTPAPQPTLIPLHIIELPALEALSISCLQLTMNLYRYPYSWGRLTDICFESPVSDTDLLEILKQCHNLITLDANIQIPWDRPADLEPTLEMVLLPHLEVLKLHESGPTSPLISTINAPSIKSLQYRCPHRYENDGLPNLEASSLLIPESLIWLISNAATSLQSLSIDPSTLQCEHVLQCLQLAAHVKELIFTEKLFFPPPNFEEDILFEPDFFDLESFTVHTPEYDSSTPGGTPLQNDILLPNLESLEVNGSYVLADENLRRILLSRIDSAQRGLTSPLRRVKVRFARKKREDIEPEIVARARDAGIEMKLDLLYRLSVPYIGPLSPSFLLPERLPDHYNLLS